MYPSTYLHTPHKRNLTHQRPLSASSSSRAIHSSDCYVKGERAQDRVTGQLVALIYSACVTPGEPTDDDDLDAVHETRRIDTFEGAVSNKRIQGRGQVSYIPHPPSDLATGLYSTTYSTSCRNTMRASRKSSRRQSERCRAQQRVVGLTQCATAERSRLSSYLSPSAT